MCHGWRRRALDPNPSALRPETATLVVASFVTSMLSFVMVTAVIRIVVIHPSSQIAVTASGEVVTMSSVRSPPVTRLPIVMPGVATLDPVATSVQHVGEVGVSGKHCYECQKVEVVVDSLAPIAVIGVCAGGAEQAAQDECCDCRDLPDCPFRRMH